MQNPNIKTKVVHSQSKTAWNVIGETIGGKYKIARVPYVLTGNKSVDQDNKNEALEHAIFISECFNYSDTILSILKIN